MAENLLHQLLKRIYGKPSWNVQKGYGSGITFEFGKPKLIVWKDVFRPSKTSKRKYPHRSAYVHGEWHLWIYCCDGGLYQDSQSIADSRSNGKKVEQACAIINGQILTEAVVDALSKRTDFHFDLGAHLQTKPFKGQDKPYEMWTLYCPKGLVLAFRDDGKYSYMRGNTRPEKKRWLPFTV